MAMLIGNYLTTWNDMCNVDMNDDVSSNNIIKIKISEFGGKRK